MASLGLRKVEEIFVLPRTIKLSNRQNFKVSQVIESTLIRGFSSSVSDLDTKDDVIVSGGFDKTLKVWSLPDCQLLRTIDAKHPVNCVSVHGDVAASW